MAHDVSMDQHYFYSNNNSFYPSLHGTYHEQLWQREFQSPAMQPPQHFSGRLSPEPLLSNQAYIFDMYNRNHPPTNKHLLQPVFENFGHSHQDHLIANTAPQMSWRHSSPSTSSSYSSSMGHIDHGGLPYNHHFANSLPQSPVFEVNMRGTEYDCDCDCEYLSEAALQHTPNLDASAHATVAPSAVQPLPWAENHSFDPKTFDEFEFEDKPLDFEHFHVDASPLSVNSYDTTCSHDDPAHPQSSACDNSGAASLGSSDSDSEWDPPSRCKGSRQAPALKLAKAKVTKRTAAKVVKNDRRASVKLANAVSAATAASNPSLPISPTTTATIPLSPAPTSSSITIASSPTERPRHFSCPLSPYGCTATFATKNEWKRHVSSQHLNLECWRCDLCPDAAASPNDFCRKDLFTQHLRRMHGDVLAASDGAASAAKDTKKETHGKSRNTRRASVLDTDNTLKSAADAALSRIRNRCHVKVRDAPAAGLCATCDERFAGAECAEKWLEHAGRHLLERKDRDNTDEGVPWEKDVVLRAWLVAEGLLVQQGEGWIVAEAEALSTQRGHAVQRRDAARRSPV